MARSCTSLRPTGLRRVGGSTPFIASRARRTMTRATGSSPPSPLPRFALECWWRARVCVCVCAACCVCCLVRGWSMRVWILSRSAPVTSCSRRRRRRRPRLLRNSPLSRRVPFFSRARQKRPFPFPPPLPSFALLLESQRKRPKGSRPKGQDRSSPAVTRARTTPRPSPSHGRGRQAGCCDSAVWPW
jgi:hypothetical protein